MHHEVNLKSNVKLIDKSDMVCKKRGSGAIIEATKNFSSEQLGARLRSARETAAFSTRAVARMLALQGIPVTHATVANYEKGATFPSTATVRALAAIYKRPVEWFFKLGPALTGARYRCLKSVRSNEKQIFEGNSAALFQIYIELENILGRYIEQLPFKIELGETDRKAAERLRVELKIGTQPLPSVIELLERFGVRVIQIDTQSRIDGFAAVFGSTPVVALNARLPNDRIRFNGGHELRHVIFGDTEAAREECDEDEKQAHDFASHLLLPQPILEEAIASKSMIRLIQVKELYGVSLAAMVYRARASNIITAELYEQIWKDFSRLGWRKDEPGIVRPDRPRRLEQLIESAVSEGKLSYGDVARIGGLDEAAVRQRVLVAMGGESLGSHTP